MKVFEIINAYNLLSEAKINSLNIEDVKKVLSFRKAARPVVEDFEKFRQDAEESLRPDNFNELVELEKLGDKRTEEQTAIYVDAVRAYRSSINEALDAEWNKEITANFDKLSEGALPLLIKANDWPLAELEKLEFLLG